jgi:hypothetical protein
MGRERGNRDRNRDVGGHEDGQSGLGGTWSNRKRNI